MARCGPEKRDQAALYFLLSNLSRERLLPTSNSFQQVLICFDGESQERSGCRVSGRCEVVVFKPGDVVTQCQPHVASQVVADVGTEAVVEDVRVVGMVNTGAHADVPTITESMAEIGANQVGVTRET